ncbi:MAG TPA: hypothetical protein VE955_07030 [Candidatus Dormibacteraeota bacterium]|nr:hypothetical protein [Candidatus Dormibacteraeota bacterium]
MNARSLKITRGNIIRLVLLAIFPWLPAYLYERIDFYFGTIPGGGYWYYQFSGTRLEADVVSFALGGLLVAYLLRPRWAIIQVFLSASLIWSLFYVACSTFRSDGLLHSECYQTGPDGLAGFRLAAMMFSFGALPAIIRAAPKGASFDRRVRLPFALASSFVLTVVMVWFPLTAWFSGVTYIPPLDLFQTLILIGVPQLATGIPAARIGRSLKTAASAGVVSLVATSAGLWTLQCPNCDRSILYPLVPSWALFALLGGLVELGPPKRLRLLFGERWFGRMSREDLGRVAVALVMTVCLSTLAIYNSWDARVLYQPTISPVPANLVLGQSIYPYVAGYYNSTQYRICCLEVGVSFAKADLGLLSPDNFLMAGMGVQSPNCCVDGWDLGWRADVFLMPDGSLIVSGSTWGTCDGNANCGGYFWQQLRYHAQATVNTQNVSTLVHLRMMWEPVSINGQTLYQANWYYNTTSVPWTRFGGFLPDFREGPYFDIGLVGGITSNIPQDIAYFSQFGVASKFPVSGWKVLLLYPSFQYQGTWRMMERANVVQGDHSYWKVMYRWGGEPYQGVTVEASSTNSSLAPGIAEFVYNGVTARELAALW